VEPCNIQSNVSTESETDEENTESAAGRHRHLFNLFTVQLDRDNKVFAIYDPTDGLPFESKFDGLSENDVVTSVVYNKIKRYVDARPNQINDKDQLAIIKLWLTRDQRTPSIDN